MSFTTSCFIQLQHSVDVKLVIDKLNMLGYKPCIHQYGLQEGSESTYIICKSDGLYYFAYSISYYTNDWGINCIDNKELFLALAALRDDTDKNQYWICDKVSVTIGKTYYPGNYIYYQYDEFFDKQNWHKATVEEIIEYFNKK